jgi:hypothetical protein
VFSLAVSYVVLYYGTSYCADASVEVSSAPERFVSSDVLPSSVVVAAASFEQLYTTAHAYRWRKVYEAVYMVIEHSQFDDFYTVPRRGTVDCGRDQSFCAVVFGDRISVLGRPREVEAVLTDAVRVVHKFRVHGSHFR